MSVSANLPQLAGLEDDYSLLKTTSRFYQSVHGATSSVLSEALNVGARHARQVSNFCSLAAGPSDRNYLQAPAEPFESWRSIYYLTSFLIFVR
jgi:hypothetical protein